MKKLFFAIIVTLISCGGNDEPFDTVELNGQVWSEYNMNVNVSESNASICENCEKYGRLYTYKGAQEVAEMYPGWRLPTKAEAQRLINHYNGKLEKFIDKFNCVGGYSTPDDKKRQFDGSGFWTSTFGKRGNKKHTLFAGEGKMTFDDVDTDYYISLRLIKE